MVDELRKQHAGKHNAADRHLHLAVERKDRVLAAFDRQPCVCPGLRSTVYDYAVFKTCGREFRCGLFRARPTVTQNIDWFIVPTGKPAEDRVAIKVIERHRACAGHVNASEFRGCTNIDQIWPPAAGQDALEFVNRDDFHWWWLVDF